jgi:hypothetical protein
VISWAEKFRKAHNGKRPLGPIKAARRQMVRVREFIGSFKKRGR